MKKILIIGGLGYIGGRMANFLSQKGYIVRISTRKPQENWPFNLPLNTPIIQLDYRSSEQLNKAMNGIDVVIHLAGPDAHTNFENSNILIKKHLDLTRRLFHSADRNNVKYFIYFSTIHVYGNNLVDNVTEETKTSPIYPFAQAHLKAEEIIRSQVLTTKAIIIRCSNTFGVPHFENEKCWNLVINNLCKSAFEKGKLILKSSGGQYRDFISMENVINATYHLLELPVSDLSETLFNLGSSKTFKIIEMANNIKKILKNNFKIDYPIEINGQSSEKINNTYNVSIDRLQKTGWVVKNDDIETISLLKHYQDKQHRVLN